MTLKELEGYCERARKLGADGTEAVYLEGTAATGVEGVKISVRVRARNAGLCEPASFPDGKTRRIFNIWGVPDGYS